MPAKVTAGRVASLPVAVALAASAIACGGPRESRVLAGNYCLDRMFAGDHYNITGCTWTAKLRGTTDNGPMDGPVLRLGWDERHVIALRAHVVGGVQGWMILDTRDEVLEGPFSAERLAKVIEGRPALSRIEIHDAAEAWQLLGRRTGGTGKRSQ